MDVCPARGGFLPERAVQTRRGTRVQREQRPTVRPLETLPWVGKGIKIRRTHMGTGSHGSYRLSAASAFTAAGKPTEPPSRMVAFVSARAWAQWHSRRKSTTTLIGTPG